MRTRSAVRSKVRVRALPVELGSILGTGAALIGVVASGAAIAAALPDAASSWLSVSAYGAPVAVAFTAYWWITQRL